MGMGRLAGGIAIVALACSRPDSEGWATKQLGADVAEQLRAEAQKHTYAGEQMAFIAQAPQKKGQATEPMPTAHLPRPYVVFDQLQSTVEDRPRLVYAKINEDRGFDFTASAARGIAIIEKQMIVDAVKRGRAGSTQVKEHAEMRIILVNRQTGKASFTQASRPDDVRAVLDALPESP